MLSACKELFLLLPRLLCSCNFALVAQGTRVRMTMNRSMVSIILCDFGICGCSLPCTAMPHRDDL